MEGDCRIPMSCLRPRILILNAIFWGLVCLRLFGAALVGEEKTTVVKLVAVPCWQLEEFVVATECTMCDAFNMRASLVPVCIQTGYVEKINCTKSNKVEFKSCRSAVLEEHLFWKFEGAMLGLTVIFALLVISRQRTLDRQASEKVRRQIESI